jgi:mono/diheme cytochrome c family protein
VLRIALFLTAAASAALSLSAPAAAAAADASKLFSDNCAACHQPAGEGIAGAFPALAGNAFVQGPAEPVVGVLLNGRGGMPTFRNDLDDDQIAEVVSYIRSAWGNKAAPVPPAAVAGARGAARSENAAAALQAH